MMRSLNSLVFSIFILAAIPAVSSSTEEEAAADNKDGIIFQSLFRFPASQLGPEFEQLLNLWYDEWLYTTTNENGTAIITPDPSGKQHALQSVSTPATTLFRRQCYGATPIKSPQFTNLYNNLEQRRKEIEFQYIKDQKEEMTMLHTMVKRFYPAFLPADSESAEHVHKKKVMSTVDTIHAQTDLPMDYDSPSTLAFQTSKLHSTDTNNNDDDDSPTQQWSWRITGQFSNRGMPNFLKWRVKFYQAMRTKFQKEVAKDTPGFQFEYGRPSGMYWYPPGAVREWHSNYLDLGGVNTNEKKTGNQNIYASQMWRMYFIRTVRDEEFDGLLQDLGVGGSSNDVDDQSAMHIIPGEDEGITLDVLHKAGARPLTKEEKKRQWKDVFAEEYSNSTLATEDEHVNSDKEGTLDRNSVWRLPDKNGYVTFFRLPKLFHCIVSEEVHRYSLGFAFSDEEVQALLRLAKVDFDVTGDGEGYGTVTDEL